MVRKLLVLGILPLITLIIFSSFVSAERGCCINPNADVRICTAEKIDSADCCPSPLEDYAGYYSQTGPIDPSDCLVNYFRANLDCSMVDECRVGCCCPDAVLSYKAACVPPRQFAEITEDVVDCPDLCEGLGEPPPGGECDKRPSSVEVVPTKGERELKVTWADECGADSVDVYRCSGYGCTDFAQLSTTVLPGYTDTSVYFDDGGNSGKYTYRIVAHYENDEGEYAATARGSLGNLECWKRYDERKFCIFESFYAQEPIKSYLDEQGVEQGSVELHTRFAGNFNHGFHCNSMNQLVFEKACGPGKICAVSGSQVQCLVESDCSTSRPFGLYSELTACESGNYCFYDKSKTTVNECYDCMPEMSCYDYKSEGACSGDNCRVGNCEWRATSEEIGVGVCVDLEKDNCRWCTEKGTAGMNNLDVFNLIFDACTEQKSNALSVEGYTCDVDLSCVYATCMDYGDTTACNKNGYIELDEDTNEITVKSDDHCGINVCKWFHALGCHKDADGDRRPDCSDEATADACEEDYFPPETTLFIHSTARINDIMRIIITDKQSVEDANADISQLPNSEDYTTYMCAYQDEDLCGPAKDFDFSTSERELAIIDLIEQELLRVGDNTLRYYTEDPAQNLEVVKVKDITIAVDHPLVFISSPRDGKVIGDTSVEVKGVVQDIAEITSARIIVNGVESPLSVSEGSFSTTVTLNEGLNTLYVEATNEYGEVGRSFPSTTVIVDMIPPNYSYIEPPNGYVGPGVAMINVAVYDKGGAGVDLEASEILLYND
ncbi:TPA: cadherin-like beta sandwich domain-containing protein, partial [Candidatus Woesearchaeota archaeon]|nr:cadherin-like beta sandwich domain-containing protein [Candidatus Woesearchaeota archaeon]